MKMFENTDKKVQESSTNYYCEKCNYSTSRKSQYNRHLLTNKHKILINTDDKSSEKLFFCNCGKNYCTAHRLAESHNCTYDFREEGKKILEEKNPLVVKPKVIKI